MACRGGWLADAMRAPETPSTPPPFVDWRRIYAAACVAAVVTILLLWWLTAAFDRGAIK